MSSLVQGSVNGRQQGVTQYLLPMASPSSSVITMGVLVCQPSLSLDSSKIDTSYLYGAGRTEQPANMTVVRSCAGTWLRGVGSLACRRCGLPVDDGQTGPIAGRTCIAWAEIVSPIGRLQRRTDAGLRGTGCRVDARRSWG